MSNTNIIEFDKQVELAERLIKTGVLWCYSTAYGERYETDETVFDEWQNLYTVEEMEEDESMKEIYEYWLVDDYLLSKLKEHNEPVLEIDGLNIWGRCTTGQAIALDEVIRDIAIETFG